MIALALGLCAAGAGRATADERPVLVLDGSEGGRGATMAARITVALGPDPALAPVAARFSDALRQPTPTDTSWRAPAEAALAEARELLAGFAYRQAADRARGPQDRLAQAVADPLARKLLADLVFVEGLGLAGEGGLTAAAPTFALVHRLDPGRRLSTGRYPQEVIDAFAAAAAPTTSTGALLVFASGAAEILVDGVAVGGEPASVAVGPGPHIVTARGENIDPVGRRVEAVPGQTVRVELRPVEAPLPVRLGRARDRLLAARSDRERADAVATLLGLVDARDAVIVVDDAVGELRARLYTSRGGLGPPRTIGDDIASVLRPLRPIARKPAPPGTGGVDRNPLERDPPVDRDDRGPWWRQRWAKATFGATAGVIVIGVVTAIVTRDPGSSTISGVEAE